jgi:hypothetical protein
VCGGRRQGPHALVLEELGLGLGIRLHAVVLERLGLGLGMR